MIPRNLFFRSDKAGTSILRRPIGAAIDKLFRESLAFRSRRFRMKCIELLWSFSHSLTLSLAAMYGKFDSHQNRGNYRTDVLLVPFSTPACMIQHEFIAKYLSQLGAKCTLAPLAGAFPNLAQSPTPDDWLEFPDTTALFDFLEERLKNPFYSIGIIDSVLRTASPEDILGSPRLSAGWVLQMEGLPELAEVLVERYRTIVLGDDCYAEGRALSSAITSRGKNGWVINPGKNFRKIEPPQDLTSEIRQNRPNNGPSSERLFKRKRVAIAKNLGNPPAISKSAVKKVLFLHVLTDANQTDLNHTHPTFRTYLEWTRFTLEVIQAQRGEWIIKPHPDAKRYPNESRLLEMVFRDAGLSVDLLDKAPTKREIFEAEWPIYTHSGTITWEAALLGRRVFACSAVAPADLSIQALSPDAWTEALRMNPEDARKLYLQNHGVSERDVIARRPRYFVEHAQPLFAPEWAGWNSEQGGKERLLWEGIVTATKLSNPFSLRARKLVSRSIL